MDQIRPLLLRMRPKVIIHLADEWGTKPEFVELADLANIVLRQHWFPDKYAARPNIFHLPLGYMTGFPRDLDTLVLPMSERPYTWSFIGTVNAPRREMLGVIFEAWQSEPCFVRGGGVKVQDMAKIYGQSIFIPNERGAHRLDCFRLYEAMIMGAIPVVVGEEKELEETFTFEHPGDVPPWVTAASWPEALDKCIVLKRDPTALQATQRALLEWLYDHFLLARERITKALCALP
jgi:hypothetical protein